MKPITMFLIWIAVSGLTLGTGVNKKAERCAAPVEITVSDVFASMTWPVVLVASFVLDRDNVALSACVPTELAGG